MSSSGHSASFPAPRVTPSAAHAFGGIWRLTMQKFFTAGHWLMLAGMLALLVLASIPATPTRAAAADGLLPWASRLYVCFLVSVLSFISAAGAVREDLRADTIDYIFTRPISRPMFVLFRYVSQVAFAQINFLLALAVVAGLGVYWDVPGWWQAMPLLLLGQTLGIVAFSAFGFFAGVLTSRYTILGLGYATVVEVGIGSVPTQLNQFSMVRHLMALMRPVLGADNFGVSGVAAAAAPVSTASALVSLAGFTLVMLTATMAIFSVREFAGSGGRDV